MKFFDQASERSDSVGEKFTPTPVVSLADEATGGQVLIAQRLHAEVENDVDVEPIGEFMLKGFQRPVAAFDVVAVRSAAPEPSRR